jgi:hypothetical protein
MIPMIRIAAMLMLAFPALAAGQSQPETPAR